MIINWKGWKIYKCFFWYIHHLKTVSYSYFCTMMNKNRHNTGSLSAIIPLVTVIVTIVAYSCASIGRPEGGPVDETPPLFTGSTPAANSIENTRKKIILEFNEFIKLENVNEKVVISPPQIQQPEIKPNGKRITVNILDTLKKNTTYTIDFADAISDNNEGNPLGHFTFAFSTGNTIDTMAVSGTVLNASDLEPVKGMLVGLHANLADSVFTSLPFERVSRTDSRGRFTVKGIAPGTYRLYGLKDADQNYAFTQKSEAIAFHDSLIVPRFEERMRQDTMWKDSLTIDTIIERKYTHFLPDQLLLRSFTEDYYSQYLIKSERLIPHKFSLYFAEKADTLPLIKGINFDEKDAFMVEKSLNNDTIHYWIKDSLTYRRDTLMLAVSYLYTDTLDKLTPRTDTLKLAIRKTERNNTSLSRKKKDNKEETPPLPTVFLNMNAQVPSPMDVYNYITLLFDEPLDSCNVSAMRIRHKVDTLWENVPLKFERDSIGLRKYYVYCDWVPKEEYEFETDSLAFTAIYGLHTNKMKKSFKVRSLDDYGAIYFNVTGANMPAFVELLDKRDKVIQKVPVIDNKADFNYLNPGTYCARLIEDANGNGVWDTGNYAEKRHPEKVYYYPQMLELKSLWELEQDWNAQAIPPDKQKQDELKKQKPDEDKKKKTKIQ
ncbi:hypothetical protein EZS27_027980 [termite gut metagenome]|uniref:SbsA Ig-like domain-containing protein n=1 Tax=termite gut metagenome TaxID=433724 RepID=A0A5J4QNA1_9ZZZZ